MNSSTFLEMPKIDLHHHLDGAFRASSLYQEAVRRNLPQAKLSYNEFQAKCRVRPNCRSLTEFLDVFNFYYDIGSNIPFLKHAAQDAVEDFKNDGVLYAETRFAPHLFGIGDEVREAVNAVLEGLENGHAKGGPKVNLILCMMRGHSAKFITELIDLALEFKNRGVVAIDLAGDESRYSGDEYSMSFSEVHSAGIPVTIHAGEAAGAESVWRALKNFHAVRIGHGIRSREDLALVKYLIEHGIFLEICVTSNLQTGTVESIESHPLKEYLAQGVKVTLNTDDPSVSDITLSGEWETVAEKLNLGAKEILQILLNSADAAFISEQEKQNLRQTIRQYSLFTNEL
ncbi:MAG: adenosine deaminase [Leptospiraceae bacterium]|nr:adenosine deaminase [Leptospiraceae bacterium]